VGKADWREADNGCKGSRETGRRRLGPREGGGRDPIETIFTTMLSMTMMASSTSRPNEMISAPSVMRSSARSVINMMTNTMARVSGTAAATTIPTRQPKLMRLTIITTLSATKNLSMNSSIASLMTAA
jgi:hypothetical protein